MGIIVEWVKGQRSTSEVINETLTDLGEGILDAACSIRAKYPNRFASGGLLTPVMDRLCSDNGSPVPPPIPAPEFSGGQCEGVRYSVLVEYAATFTITRDRSTAVYGAIQGADGVSDGAGGVRIIVFAKDENGQPFEYQLDAGAESQGFGSTVEIVSISRIDGLPDDCGDPPVDRLPDPPLTDSDFKRTIEICGTPNAPDSPRCVDVEVEFDPDLDENGNQCYTVDGDRYCFTPDGVVKDEPTAPAPDDLPPDGLAPEQKPESEEDEEEDDSIRWVTVQISQLPGGGKQVFHAQSKDNDYFAGYFHWLVKAGGQQWYLPAIPIRKEFSAYKAPEGIVGYRMYAVNSARLVATTYKETGE